MFPIQAQQFLNLLFFVLLAYFFEHLYLDLEMVLFIVSFTVFIEHLFIYIKHTELTYFSFSSLTTALGVMLMMVAENIWIYIFAIAFGLGQKHFVTLHGRHFFNPSNFALLMAMCFFYNDAHIVLGQLGDNIYVRIIVIVLAVVILNRVERLLLPITFIISYIIMQYFFIVSYDSTLVLEDIYLRFYSVSFILFLLFMLTDPHTTPTSVGYQVAFAIFIAVLSVSLDRYYGFRVQHLFMALFILSPFVSLLELYQKEKIDIQDIVKFTLLIFLVLGVIISIESNPPYYFEMDR
jgi:hypothetical protein